MDEKLAAGVSTGNLQQAPRGTAGQWLQGDVRQIRAQYPHLARHQSQQRIVEIPVRVAQRPEMRIVKDLKPGRAQTFSRMGQTLAVEQCAYAEAITRTKQDIAHLSAIRAHGGKADSSGEDAVHLHA